jgi:beta-glucosidase-like glycosyl hydrolase
MIPFGDLVAPAIRWDAAAGFEPYRARIEQWIELGVGGFVLFGGERGAVQTLTRELRDASPRELLIGSDVERGAGQQVRGLTSLPPLGALAGLGEQAVREAARLTALECRDVGINWAFGPVCDLDIEPNNPIVQTRSFGADAFAVGHLAAAWVQACQAEGVLACAKHFPGHGRTTMDSHATLPVVPAGRELERDLIPFRLAVGAEVASVMSCHVAFPAWDPSGVPATHSTRLLRDLLRRDLFFAGLTVTDALIMEGARAGASESEGAIRALLAGCDILLYPHEPVDVITGIAAAIQGGNTELAGFVAQSSLRREQTVRRAGPTQTLSDATLAVHRAHGEALCRDAVRMLRSDPPALRGAAEISIVDDDAGGPYPLPARTAFQAELERLGVEVRPGGQRIVLLFADVKSWKGRAGLSTESAAALSAQLATPALVVLFGHPRRQTEIPGVGPVVCAWSGDEAMQRAAAQRLVRG